MRRQTILMAMAFIGFIFFMANLPIVQLVEFEINDGSIQIIYGTDELGAVFLTVFDRRLVWEAEASDVTNEIVREIWDNGDGKYLSLTTGPVGGKRVSKSTMADFMARYGVPKTRIDDFFKKKKCICNKKTKSQFVCPNCEMKYYCSYDCLLKDWKRHGRFCDIKLPEKEIKETSSTKSIYGVLLMPENNVKPKFVEVTLNLIHEKDGVSFWKPKLDEYFHGKRYESPRWGGGFGIRSYNKNDFGHSSSDSDEPPRVEVNLREHNPTHMKNTLQFYHQLESFMNDDDSKLNECVRTITNGRAAHPWTGPMLVLKVKGFNKSTVDEYMDMMPEDCGDMIDFFLLYGR